MSVGEDLQTGKPSGGQGKATPDQMCGRRNTQATPAEDWPGLAGGGPSNGNAATEAQIKRPECQAGKHGLYSGRGGEPPKSLSRE